MNIVEKLSAFTALLLLAGCMLSKAKRTAFAQKHAWIHRLTSFHTAFAILLLITGLLHGILAGNGTAMITGKIAWMLLLILALLAPLKQKTGKHLWLRIHNLLALSACLFIVIHIFQALAV